MNNEPHNKLERMNMHEDNKRNAMLTKQKKTRKRNKNYSRGGVAVIRECAETKQKKNGAWRGREARYWAWGNGAGQFQGNRFGEGYIRVVSPFPFILLLYFSLIPFLKEFALFSLLTLSSSPTEGMGVPAAVGRPVRRHHRVGTLKLIFFKFFFVLSACTLLPKHVS